MQSRSFRKPKGENIWKEAYEAGRFSRQYSRSERHGGADAPAWANVDEVLAQYGATIDNIVDEVLFVTDMEAALAAAGKIRPEVFCGYPGVASTTAAICAGRRPVFGRLSGTMSSKFPSHVES